MDMEMIKVTFLSCKMSTITQKNSVSENSFSAVELKCDYYKRFLSSQAFLNKKEEFEFNNFCFLMCFVPNTSKNVFHSVGGKLEMRLISK